MRRTRSSELYQVDFVAALFGGFLLVWLSGISEAEFPGGSGKRPVFFELSARAFYDKASGPGEGWAPLLPASALELGCAHPSMVGLAKSNTELVACKTLLSEELNFDKDKSKDYRLRVKQAAEERKRPVRYDGAQIDGTPLELLLSDNGAESVARFAGMAFVKLTAPETVDGRGLANNFRLAEIGIIRDATLSSGPKFVKIDPAGRLDTYMFVVPTRALNTASGFDIIDTDSYYFTNMPSTAAYGGLKPAVNSIEVQLRFDKESGGGCYRARINIPTANDRIPLDQPC